MKTYSEIAKLAKTLDGIPVLGCFVGSPAQRAGIQAGDIILFVNGVRTRTLSEYAAVQVETKGPLDLIVFRDGAELQVRVNRIDPAEDEASDRIVERIIRERLIPIPPEVPAKKSMPS